MSKKRKRESRYYPSELTQFLWCTACLGVAISENEQAKEIYDGIVESSVNNTDHSCTL